MNSIRNSSKEDVRDKEVWISGTSHVPILLEEHKDCWNGKWVVNAKKPVPVAVGFLSLTRAKAQEMVNISHVDLVSQSPFWPWVNTVWLNSPCARLRADFVLQPTLVIQISAQLSIDQLLTKERFISIPSQFKVITSPLPQTIMDMPWTQKLLNSLAKYLCPLYPLCRMHSLQFTYKIKKQC